MILRIYSIFDLKAQAFSAPFTHVNDEVAKRVLRDMLASNNSIYSRHPEDFALYFVGEFDDASAQITVNENSLVNIVATLGSLMPPVATDN